MKMCRMSASVLAVLLAVLIDPSSGLGSCKQAALCCSGRDSSCVVQKAAINAIIEDLQDQPCYCDHACLKLNDCCPDYRQTCGVQDCQVSDWGAWSECDNACGPGSQSRTRTILTEPHHGGKTCPPTLQKRGCQGTRGCVASPGSRASTKAALKETAMLLPVTFGASRRANDTHDIRRNLRFRTVKPTTETTPAPESNSDYGVRFELTKVTKACHQEKFFGQLHDGAVVCVRCERAATRSYLGGRCAGHGVTGRVTRWTSLTNVDCHGKWVRRPEEDQESNCVEEAAFIFV